MTNTTVLTEDSTTIVSDAEPKRFNWSAAFAGAFIATAVTFFLLTLGSGVGLSLVSARGATADSTATFLTLGAIYFLVAQAFGFAAGGHIVGRLIGPALETDREEQIRAGTHGLVSWALAVVATASVIALAAIAGGSAAANGAINGALASSVPSSARTSDANQTALTGYWVDTLLRPAGETRASLSGFTRYAQAETGTATDAATAPPEATITPDETTALTPTPAPVRTPSEPVVLDNTTSAPVVLTAPTVAPNPAAARSLAADKAEMGRILTVGLANGGTLRGDDRLQLAIIVSRETGMTLSDAQRRVGTVLARIHHDEVQAAEFARKSAAYAALWTAFALLFGAIVVVASAISARWEDDKEAGLLPGTRVSAVRF